MSKPTEPIFISLAYSSKEIMEYAVFKKPQIYVIIFQLPLTSLSLSLLMTGEKIEVKE